MKTKLYITTIIVLAAINILSAQNIEHPWWVFDKGGGSSQTGSFSLIGSFGQTAVEVSTSNGFILISGFIPGVEDPDMFTLCIAKSDVKCYGGNDGSITASPTGGTPPYEFSLNKTDWQSEPTFSGLAPGNYTVYAKTEICTTLTHITINQPPDILCNISKPDTIFNCRTSGNILCVTAEGGFGNLTYNWTVTSPKNDWHIYEGETSSCILYLSGSDSAVFKVVITDENGCVDSCMITMRCNLIAQGCSPGFWKNSTHYWNESHDPISMCVMGNVTAKGLPYQFELTKGVTAQLYRNIFGLTVAQMTAKEVKLKSNLTMLEAINLGGGAFQKLARHSVAGLLNSCILGDYAYTTDEILTLVRGAFISKKSEPLASKLDTANNKGCPLPASIGGKTGEIAEALPTEYGLSECYPNPFNPSTTIEYNLPEPSTVRLSVFNVLGQEIATLVAGIKEEGYHTVEFTTDVHFSSGVYIYRMNATSLTSDKNYTSVKKMLLLK